MDTCLNPMLIFWQDKESGQRNGRVAHWRGTQSKKGWEDSRFDVMEVIENRSERSSRREGANWLRTRNKAPPVTSKNASGRSSRGAD